MKNPVCLKKLFLLLFLFSFVVVMHAQKSSEVIGHHAVIPFSEIDGKVLDFGVIMLNSNPRRKIWVINDFTETLKITRARANKGYLIPLWPREPIAPKDTFAIELRYDTKRIGNYFPSLSIFSNLQDPVTLYTEVNVTIKHIAFDAIQQKHNIPSEALAPHLKEIFKALYTNSRACFISDCDYTELQVAEMAVDIYSLVKDPNEAPRSILSFKPPRDSGDIEVRILLYEKKDHSSFYIAKMIVSHVSGKLVVNEVNMTKTGYVSPEMDPEEPYVKLKNIIEIGARKVFRLNSNFRKIDCENCNFSYDISTGKIQRE